jgi:hypothetical protein
VAALGMLLILSLVPAWFTYKHRERRAAL